MTRIPKPITEDAQKWVKFLETEPKGETFDWWMREYFCAYWPEFGKYWLKNTGEKLDWVSFIVPHNAQYFVEYIFVKYPEKRKEVIEELTTGRHWSPTI